MEREITKKPFNWNDNMSEEAKEVFEIFGENLSYNTKMTIGMALAKLELLEKQGCEVKETEEEL